MTFTEADLIAKPLFSSVYIRFENQIHLWRFTKTTPHNWRRTNPQLRPAWASNAHLAYLITQGTPTNSLGETL